MFYYLLRNDGTVSDLADYLEQPEERVEGQWVQGVPEGLPIYAPISLDQQIKALYMAAPILIQAKYQQEILNGLLCLREENFPMVGYNLAQAQAKLDTENQNEVDLLTQVGALLMPILPPDVISQLFQSN